MKSKPLSFFYWVRLPFFIIFLVLPGLVTFVDAQQMVLTHDDDPLELPLQNRMDFFKKGNLVQNASFEKGTEENASLKLEHWKINGTAIDWVDKTSFKFSATEVFDGARSIRIQRKGVGETDASVGLQSDFIEVIPGNYEFSLFIKLSDISAATERLGTRLYDAVDLHLDFFDAQKKIIDPKALYPTKNVFLDNSFKGYSFSNFYAIDEFDWGLVNGRTYNYPFSEGDLPAGTRFVKISIGLKGNGTMWVDKVDFRYSHWNFTPLERVMPYANKNYHLTELLIPEPKEISNVRDVSYYDKSRPALVPVVLLPEKADKQTLSAARLIKEHLESSLKSILGKDWKKDIVILTSRLTDSLSKTASVIFSIGDNELCLRYADSLPQQFSSNTDQAYFIKNVGGKMIFLKGKGAVGDYYAAATLIQLIDSKEFLIRSADIADNPDFLGRSVLLTPWRSQSDVREDISNLEQAVQWKLNKAYVGYGQPNKDWHIPDEYYRYGVEKVAAYCKAGGLYSLAMMVNPYYHFDEEMDVDSIPDKLRYMWTHGDPHSLEMLKNVFSLGLDSGANCIMLMADDYMPHKGANRKNYGLYTPEDEKRFINIQNAQAYIINELYKWLEQNYPGTRFEFCPPWYLNEFIDRSRGRAENYFTDLSAMIPEDVAFVWTGNTVRSLAIDQADIYRYASLAGRYPMLWDNTLYARSMGGVYGGWPAHYPYKTRLCNLFEPYDVKLPEHFSRYNDGPHMYVNGDLYSDFYKIKFMTVADFEWNNEAYQADFSLWKALLKTYGKETALKLMTFNDLYYQLMQLNILANAGIGDYKDTKSKGDGLIKEMGKLYNELAKTLESHKVLMSEMRVIKDEQIRTNKTALEVLKKNKPK